MLRDLFLDCLVLDPLVGVSRPMGYADRKRVVEAAIDKKNKTKRKQNRRAAADGLQVNLDQQSPRDHSVGLVGLDGKGTQRQAKQWCKSCNGTDEGDGPLCSSFQRL